MFTGIIQSVGKIDSVQAIGSDLRLSIACANLGLQDVQSGDSIAVNGACLTATIVSERHFEALVSQASLAVTVGLNQPQAVNLEKALRLSDRLGGHLVSGHVDGVGKIASMTPEGGSVRFVFEAPGDLARFIAAKGSIAVDGISLTVNEVKANQFHVNIISHTQAMTTLGTAKAGQRVNLEVDMLARYVQRLLEHNKS